MTAPINGFASIATEAAPCFVVLIRESDGVPVGNTQCAPDGSYSFPAPASDGNYAIVFLDPAGGYRGKVVHVTVGA